MDMETNSLQPQAAPKSAPRDVFAHLLAFVALYVSVISMLTLLFQYVNVWFPDPLYPNIQSVLNGIRWSSAALVVMFPVYLLMNWLIGREMSREPARREVKIRKWLVYLTLFAAALTVIVDIITLIYNFLGGELTLRFFLKTLAVLAVAAAVFGYYWWDLRGSASARASRVIGWAGLLVVLAAVAAGFFIAGTPAEQRQLRFDERRVSDLQMIQNEVVNYWTQKQALPASLSDLRGSISGFVPPEDPEASQPYEYNVKSELVFELCAVFALPSARGRPMPEGRFVGPKSVSGPYGQNWTHEAGRACFERVIDPELFRPPPGI